MSPRMIDGGSGGHQHELTKIEQTNLVSCSCSDDPPSFACPHLDRGYNMNVSELVDGLSTPDASSLYHSIPLRIPNSTPTLTMDNIGGT